jgi:hypothetical protein
MLISMPTGTSTIFGVFQVIRVSQVVWRDVRRTKGRTAPGLTQVLALTLCDVPRDFFSTSSDICGNIGRDPVTRG